MRVSILFTYYCLHCCFFYFCIVFYSSVLLMVLSSPFMYKNIRIYHECEGRIEKSVLRIAVWHHKACRVMTNGDPEGRVFLSYPHTNNGFLFLLITVFLFKNKLPEVPEYATIHFNMMTSL